MHHYLARVVGAGTDDDPFRPDGADELSSWTSIDLRPDPTGVVGRVLLAGTERLPDVSPARRVYLGDSMTTPNTAARTALSGRLGVTLEGSSLRDLIRELLVAHGRDDGSRWRPLRPGRDGWYEISFGGEVDRVMPTIKGGATITESFNKADSTTLGPDITWTEVTGNLEVVSNQCRPVSLNSGSTARAEQNLDSDNHYAQVSIVALSGGDSVNTRALGRFSTSAQTWYEAVLDADTVFLRKSVSGTITALVSDAAITLPTMPFPLRVECDGSTIRAVVDGTTRLSATDTAITGNLRTGIRLFNNSASLANVVVDNFEAGDLGLTISPSGSITPSGTLAKHANKAAAGSITPTASLAKAVSKALTATITPTGSIAKQANKALAGSVTPSGALAAIKTALLSLAGAITPSGALAKLVGKSTSGSITPTSSLSKAITKAIAGTLAPAGALAKAVAKAIAGTIAPAGSLATEEIVEAPAVTVTYRDSGHTGTYKDDGHTGTYRSSGHTGTYRESRR